jgi:hypothetical protein
MPAQQPQSPGEHVEVLEMNEAYEEVDGSFTFAGTLVVYRTGSDLHHAITKTRYLSLSDVQVERLDNDVVIPLSAYSPLFPPEFTRAPDPLPPNSHIKRPRLISYDQICKGSQLNHIAESVLLEAAVCEL